MVRVLGDPPRWLIQIQHNAKYLFRAALVGQFTWAEVACWYTSRSSMKGWKFSFRHIITPWVGVGWTI